MSTTMEHFDVYKVTFDAYNTRSFNYGAATPSTAMIVTDIDTLHAIVWYINTAYDAIEENKTLFIPVLQTTIDLMCNTYRISLKTVHGKTFIQLYDEYDLDVLLDVHQAEALISGVREVNYMDLL